MKRLFLLLLPLALLPACNAPKEVSYLDKTLPAEVRAADLLSKLTLEEKTALVQYESQAIPRLGIPAYNWWNEALHGVARNGSATVFPQPIGMAASFDTEKIEAVFTAVSDEARVKNREARESGTVGQYQGLTFWTPNINIFRDPRWGRGMETYGEDPYLTGQLGMAVVRGLQGDPKAPVLKAHACAKHFAVHSGLESNRHQFDAQVSERDLRETYLPAFKDLVTKAGVKEVMTAYNRFRGKPCAASDYLVKDILRGEWKYAGMIVSDCWAIPDFFVEGRHGYVPTEAAAAAAAVENGVDVECGSSYRSIPEAVASGLLKEEYLDRNLLRALTERFRLGEMDGASPWDDLDPAIVEGPEHRALSLSIAHESMVLLHNRGMLPLKAGQKIALIGPNADDAAMQWGNYNPIPKSTVTLLDAFRTRVPDLVYDRACDLVDPVSLDPADVLRKLDGVDVVVFAGGISPRLEGEEMPVAVPGFAGGDRTDSRQAGGAGELLRLRHRPGAGNGDLRRHPPSLVSRPGRRHGHRRRPFRRRQSFRQTPGDFLQERGTASRGGRLQYGRPHLPLFPRRAAVSVRLWPELHFLRLRRTEGERKAPDRFGDQHRLLRRNGGGPALCPPARRCGRPAQDAPRLPARGPGRR